MQVVVDFVTSAAGVDGFPTDGLPEVVFVGRSNVGKSTLINALVRRPVARTSAAPGKTRLANFFRVRRGSAPPCYFVDLPGYGYARGGDAAAAEFNALTSGYFARAARDGRSGGVRMGALLLVDARHPGLESDLEAWTWLATQPCARGIVGTKGDKLTRAERARQARALHSAFDYPVPLVSARTGEGLDELWKTIARLPNRTVA